MIRVLLDAALDLVFPPRRICPLCGGYSYNAAVCSNCIEFITGYKTGRVCSCCGRYIDNIGSGAIDTSSVFCFDCRSGRPFELARAVGPYEGPLRDAVHRFKYRRARWQARPMAKLMAETFRSEPAYSHTRGLVPVPLHPSRERRRGFNQAALLARALGNIIGVPVLEHATVRVRKTPPQTNLDRHERLRNLEGAFVVREPERITGKIITVVDDVFTTGTTVSIISRELRQAGAAGVMVLTFAIARHTGKR